MLTNNLHGFIEGRGMGTVTLEAKLVQHLARIERGILFQVFLDVLKTYESLYRER